MTYSKPNLSTLQTESDVEQKFLYPLLTAKAPFGLGLDGASIQTKPNIRRITIGKGAEKKLYFPDYVFILGGFPLLVVEAKAPGADIIEAFREARLYALEMNSQFRSGFNPVSHIIASDGVRTVAGFADEASPVHEILFEEINVYSEKFAKFVADFSTDVLAESSKKLMSRVRPSWFWKPRKLLGGGAVQREEVGLNTFGATISADFSRIFNPIAREDRAFIARHAYIPSKRRERYIEPIDRVIRAAAPPSEARSRTIEDTGNPQELVKTFRAPRPLEHQVLLVVGSAGAGKSTFVDYLCEIALPRDIRERTLWLRVDMNPAPISREEIYNWLRDRIVEGCKAAHPEIDFDDINTIKSINSVEIKSFRKGIGRLYERDPVQLDAKLAEYLTNLMTDRHKAASNYARHFATERGRLLVIVLDNCDKRLRDEQLLMFEAAQWLKNEFRALVVLPLREETYDNHQNEPPLDTALKDLVFRIEPPLFQKILQARVHLVLSNINKSGHKTFRYKLPNGMHVEYAASDQAYYLASILRSIFEYDLHVRRLIVGLAGRNMRRALEIFLEFCTSGHISENHILRIRSSEGNYVLPLGVVTTVLLRLNQRYYDSNHAYLKNVFASEERDALPSYFTRILILQSLRKRMNSYGPMRLKGYVTIRDLRGELSPFGIEPAVFLREIEALARGLCLVSEDFRVQELTDDDLIALSPAGIVHIDMARNVYYLAAIAEDTWFDKQDTAQGIADRIRDIERQYLPSTVFYNAHDLIETLKRATDRALNGITMVLDKEGISDAYDLNAAAASVDAFERSIVSAAWQGANRRYPTHSVHDAMIDNVAKFGIFVRLPCGLKGLIHNSKLPAGYQTDPTFKVGGEIRVRVQDVDAFSERVALTPLLPREVRADNQASRSPD